MISSLLFHFLLEATSAAFLTNRELPSFEGLPTINELAARGGYVATNYEVITEDGYSLWLHRIGNNTGPPALIQHGMFVAAESWITKGNTKDLAFLLLKEGFDVWLSNERGTAYNKYSLRYHRRDPRFWDFSFHESGYYDTPAFIDTILEVRRTSQLFYIGHSLGSTVFLVMASTRPEYNSKIQAAVLLSPIAFLPAPDELTPTFQVLLQNADLIYNTLLMTGQHEIGYRTELSVKALRELCTRFTASQEVCLGLIGLMAGEHRSNFDKKDLDAFIPYYLAGTSLKTLYHCAQVARSGEFKQYDYGWELNLVKYWATKPPTYRLDLVTAPVALHWGKNDPLTSSTEIGIDCAASACGLFIHPYEPQNLTSQVPHPEHNSNYCIRFGGYMVNIFDIPVISATSARFPLGKSDKNKLRLEVKPLFSQVTSVGKLASALPNLISATAVPDPLFSHVDMYLGDNAGQILYPDILSLFKSFSRDEDST